MRQDHKGGEKLFVDYGEGLSLVDPQSSDPITTQLFVAVWGASTYTFAEATLTQQLPDWIGSPTRAFDYFGCVPKIVVPDCLKSAVSRACRPRFRHHVMIAVRPFPSSGTTLRRTLHLALSPDCPCLVRIRRRFPSS
jgi:transposase